MKKLLFSLVMLVCASAFAFAGDTYAHDASVLPKAAQTTLANNFKSKVSVVKIEKTLGRITEYEVIMSDGTEISFDRDGNWDNVEVNESSSVPSGFIPKGVQAFIKKNQPGQKVIGIDKERGGYEVDLSNGVEIKFDKNGNFLKYD